MNLRRQLNGALLGSSPSSFSSFPLALCLRMTTTTTATESTSPPTITVLGFGSLLSEKSARTTFPDLRNFRLGRVPDHRRVFSHPAPIFFERGIADLATLQIASLSAEPAPGCSFVCAVFEVEGIMSRAGTSSGNEAGVYDLLTPDFIEREEEFRLEQVKYIELIDDEEGGNGNNTSGSGSGSGSQELSTAMDTSTGVLCLRSTDEEYVRRWGSNRFEDKFKRWGIDTIWNWGPDSGIRPCATYLRHCVLASRKSDNLQGCAATSFLDDTFLVDRTTTLRTYLNQNPQIMKCLPPPELVERYGG